MAPIGTGNAKNIQYDKNEFITNVGCDYQKGTLGFTLKNNAAKDLQLYHGEIPQASSSLRVSINDLQFNSKELGLKLDCGEAVVKAGETRTCIGEGIGFRKPDTNFNQKGQNRLLGQYLGGSDVTFFECG